MVVGEEEVITQGSFLKKYYFFVSFTVSEITSDSSNINSKNIYYAKYFEYKLVNIPKNITYFQNILL